MRDIEAYGVQMKDDITWAGSNIYFNFPAGPAQLLGGLRESTVYPYLVLMLWSSLAYVLCILYCMGY